MILDSHDLHEKVSTVKEACCWLIHKRLMWEHVL